MKTIGDCGCRNLGSKCSRWSRPDNQRNWTTNELGRECGQAFILSVGKVIFDCYVLTLNKASFAETTAERYYLVRCLSLRKGSKKANHRG
jgi:hypothetical protein